MGQQKWSAMVGCDPNCELKAFLGKMNAKAKTMIVLNPSQLYAYKDILNSIKEALSRSDLSADEREFLKFAETIYNFECVATSTAWYNPKNATKSYYNANIKTNAQYIFKIFDAWLNKTSDANNTGNKSTSNLAESMVNIYKTAFDLIMAILDELAKKGLMPYVLKTTYSLLIKRSSSL